MLGGRLRTGVDRVCPLVWPFGDGATLTNLRFADDLVSIAQSRNDVRNMINDFAALAKSYGAKINFDKTKVLSWDRLVHGPYTIPVGANSVQILRATQSEKYLGRKLCLGDGQQIEISHRIAAAWAAFHKHKQKLCSKFYTLQDRARLFDSVVTSAALYGAETWVLTQAMCRELNTARRRMLRYVFRLHRQTNASECEPWVDCMIRSASRVDEFSAWLGLEDWACAHRRRKWIWAGRLARRSDDRWSQRILDWQPIGGLGRGQGRPKLRWEDELSEFPGGDWMNVAAEEAGWLCATEGFVSRIG